MYALILVVHVIVAFFLIAVVLLQGGRGGLGEALGGAAAQSLFGGGANTVMTKITAVAAGLFMTTCLSLAALSTAQGRSVIDQLGTGTGGFPIPGVIPGAVPEPMPVEPMPGQPSPDAPLKNSQLLPPEPAPPAGASDPSDVPVPAAPTP
jgi:preprotein translocase subunit SecG